MLGMSRLELRATQERTLEAVSCTSALGYSSIYS
jgi:hypothetical protein